MPILQLRYMLPQRSFDRQTPPRAAAAARAAASPAARDDSRAHTGHHEPRLTLSTVAGHAWPAPHAHTTGVRAFTYTEERRKPPRVAASADSEEAVCFGRPGAPQRPSNVQPGHAVAAGDDGAAVTMCPRGHR